MPYTDWIGSRETVEDDLPLGPALSARAVLDDSEPEFRAGDPLPPLWQWVYFLPRAAQSRLGPDGHPQRGGFLPPVDLPRRMFAGARLTIHQPLRLGRTAVREGEIRSIEDKQGAGGRLVFVTALYRFFQDGALCLEEGQDVVYRAPGPPLAAPQPADWPPLPADAWSRVVTPDPALLFRFSAVTFNAHRIHYDRPYATEVEGYPGLVVHGPLTAMLLMDLLRRHEPRPLARFSFRARAPLFDLAPFRLVGRRQGESAILLEAQGPDGATAMTAEAEAGAEAG
jgi:3-methylfumaryl-CoA hydratase